MKLIVSDILLYRLVRFFPNFTWLLKLWILKKQIKKKGKNFKISPDFYITPLSKFEVGNDVFINKNFYCSSNEGVLIGNRVMFGANCSIIGGDHKFNLTNENLRFCHLLGNNFKILIESDAWIGHGTTILKGGSIGEGTIVGACSLVNKVLLPYCIYAGNPIKFIKYRFSSISDLFSYLSFMEESYQFHSSYTKEELREIYEKK